MTMETTTWVPGDPVRACGECALCCKLISVIDIGKPAGEDCKHCDSKGCMIYEIRPQSCRDYMCLWVTNPDFPEDLRPDRCGVVWELTEDGKVVLAACLDEISANSPIMEGMIGFFRQNGISVLGTILSSPDSLLVLAPGTTEADVLRSVTATAVAQSVRLAEREVATQ